MLLSSNYRQNCVNHVSCSVLFDSQFSSETPRFLGGDILRYQATINRLTRRVWLQRQKPGGAKVNIRSICDRPARERLLCMGDYTLQDPNALGQGLRLLGVCLALALQFTLGQALVTKSNTKLYTK